jgi:hypothetical protein
MLLSLPAPSSAELGLAAHFSTYLAFSGSGVGEDESGEEEACVVWLNNAAAAIQRRQLQEQQEQKQEENEQERQAWEGLYMLVKLEAALRAPTRARIQSELAQLCTEAEQYEWSLCIALVAQAQAVVELNHIAAAAAASGGACASTPVPPVPGVEGHMPATESMCEEAGEEEVLVLEEEAAVMEAAERAWQAERKMRECLRRVMAQGGRAEAEMRRAETFLGLWRSRSLGGGLSDGLARSGVGSALSFSKFRLPLLLSLLTHGQTDRRTTQGSASGGRVCTGAYGWEGGTASPYTPYPYTPASTGQECASGLGCWTVPASDARHELLIDAPHLRLALASMLHGKNSPPPSPFPSLSLSLPVVLSLSLSLSLALDFVSPFLLTLSLFLPVFLCFSLSLSVSLLWLSLSLPPSLPPTYTHFLCVAQPLHAR